MEDLRHYPKDIDQKLQMDELPEEFHENWKSKNYGGSVFDPVNLIDFANGVKTINRIPNNLQEDMIKMGQRLSGGDRYYKL